MKNRENWRPSKYVKQRKSWLASRDVAQVAVQSRLVADILAQAYAKAITGHAFGDLLDHGCGRMPLLPMYEGQTTSVTAIDWANSLHEIEHADVLADLNFPMPFSAGSFDTIISSDVVEHLWNSLGVFQDFARILRPGGVLILGTPFNYWLHEEPHDYFRWSPHAIRKLGSEAALDVVELHYCGGHREVLVDTLLKSVGLRNRRSLADFLDRIARLSGFVSLGRNSPGSLTLATVSVLRKR